MLAARQLLVMRGARDRAIGGAVAPVGTVALLPDPDVGRRVLRCVSHVGLAIVDRSVGRMDKGVGVRCPIAAQTPSCHPAAAPEGMVTSPKVPVSDVDPLHCCPAPLGMPAIAIR